jgi:glycosyltransferase involved in cell wall biosynthesis
MSLNQGQRHFLFLVNNYPPKTGGVENHVYNLAKSLVNLGQLCTVLTLSKEPSQSLEDGITVIRIKQGFGFGEVISFPTFLGLRKIISILQDLQPSVLSTHTRFFPMTWIGVFLGRKYRIPVVHTEHGSGFVRGVGFFVGLMSRAVDLSLGKYSLRNSTLVLAVSENVADFVYQLAKVKSEIFYNAVNLSTQEVSNQQLAWNGNPKFVFVGRLVPGKGADKTLKAIALLKKDGYFPTLELLGDGAERPKLQLLANKLGISDDVLFRGKVSQYEVMQTLSSSVYVNPTELAEGFQTTLLEAVAAGAQVVTYPAPGVTKLVSQGAPVRVVASDSVESLAKTLNDAVSLPLAKIQPSLLEFWSWKYRAKEYLQITDLSA